MERGRTLLETLSVLALSGMLTLLALAGFVYARAKVAANHILTDVSLAYAEALPETRESNRLYEISFTTDSHLAIRTVRTESFLTEWADLVIVEDVPERICRILFGMNGVNGLRLFQKQTRHMFRFPGVRPV